MDRLKESAEMKLEYTFNVTPDMLRKWAEQIEQNAKGSYWNVARIHLTATDNKYASDIHMEIVQPSAYAECNSTQIVSSGYHEFKNRL